MNPDLPILRTTVATIGRSIQAMTTPDLFTQTESGRYRPATKEEILAAAYHAVLNTPQLDAKVQTKLMASLRGIAVLFPDETES